MKELTAAGKGLIIVNLFEGRKKTLRLEDLPYVVWEEKTGDLKPGVKSSALGLRTSLLL